MKARVGLAICLVAAVVVVQPAVAHHPGEKLDETMSEREHYFQAADGPAPPIVLADAAGHPVDLADFADKIVILHFIYTRCPDVCPLHAEKLAEVQTMMNQSAMKDMVQFLTITTDPEHDTAKVLEGYGAEHGLNSSNWLFLTRQDQQSENVTRDLARAYGLEFTPTGDGLQMHGVVTFVIDHNSRLAAKFHGLRFEPLNMVLYINGLTNFSPTNEADAVSKWWNRLFEAFR